MDVIKLVMLQYMPAVSSNKIAGPDCTIITNDYDDDDVMDDPKVGKATAS